MKTQQSSFHQVARLLILHHKLLKSVNMMHPKPVTAAKSVVLRVTRLPALCLPEAVAEGIPVAEIDFVIVNTFGATVVPEIVVAGFVDAGTTVLPLTTLAERV